MTPIRVSTLRPGLLVSLKTALAGNVSYDARDIESDHVNSDGTRRAVWETTRVVEDPAEHEAGVQARSKARSLIAAVCASSAFGLLCPESAADQLAEAIAEARAVAEAFNQRAAITRLSVNVIAGRIAADDLDAVRAINAEVRDLLTAMEQGLQRLDVQAVRDAANKARELSAMLTPEAAAKAQKAIDVARSAARQIVKAGEAAAIEVDRATLAAVRGARLAFLDLDDADEMQAPAAAGRAVEVDSWEAAPTTFTTNACPLFPTLEL